MARAQTKVKKGRASSSAKRRRRPMAGRMAGSKGKGRHHERREGTASRRTGAPAISRGALGDVGTAATARGTGGRATREGNVARDASRIGMARTNQGRRNTARSEATRSRAGARAGGGTRSRGAPFGEDDDSHRGGIGSSDGDRDQSLEELDEGEDDFQGRQAGGRGRGTAFRGDEPESIREGGRDVRPEGSQPPTLVSGDATVGEQRRAASGQRSGRTTDRPPGPTRRKPGARGGGPVDRQRERRIGRGDALETGRQDLTEPTRSSSRGPEPRGGEEGRRARARRATPRGESDTSGAGRRTSTRAGKASISTAEAMEEYDA